MLELHEIADAARKTRYSYLPLEITPNATPKGNELHAYLIEKSTHLSWTDVTAQYFRLLLRINTAEQLEATNIFIQTMHNAHPDTQAIRHILRSENIRLHKPITAKKILKAYQKFLLLEQTSYEFVDDGTNTNHKELKFMHGLVLKLKTFFR